MSSVNVILLSGGSGKRLWPLSNDIRSKQFLKLFDGEGGRESMIQRMYRGIKAADPDSEVTIAAAATQASAVLNQLGDKVDISIEPCRRDTFPAIVLACNYLFYKKGVGRDEPVVVCPVDPYVDDGYFAALLKLAEYAAQEEADLVLMGIEALYPSEKYGYIILDESAGDLFEPVAFFAEKPDEKTAGEYILRGALWNAGVFAFKLGYILDKSHEILGYTDYDDLFSKYSCLDAISFDYAIAEKESSLRVMRFAGEWKDLGTWNTLTESLDENVIGNAVVDDTCSNVHVLNELDQTIVCMGLSDVVVSASVDGILVADKHQSSYMKPLVEGVTGDVRYAEKSWGEYRVIDSPDGALVIRVTLEPGNKMHYHSHEYRDEVWNIISGRGRIILDGEVSDVGPGQVVNIPAGTKHTIIADTRICLVEVQLGDNIKVDDKQKFELNI